MTASSIQRIQASADNLPPSRDPNQADAPFAEKPHQGAFQNLGVSISHNLLLRDTEGMAFPSQGNLQGEQAYVFLAALNGHALQQKNAINSPERVRLNFLLGNITATDCTISFGKSSHFQGTGAVSETLHSYFEKEGYAFPPDIEQAFQTFRQEESAYLQQHPEVHQLLDGENIRYPYLRDRIALFLADELHQEGNRRILEAMTWLSQHKILQSAIEMTDAEPLIDALYQQRLPEHLALVQACESSIQDEAVLQKAFATLVKKCLRGKLFKKYHSCAQYLGTYDLNTLKKDAICHAASPKNLVTMEQPIQSVLSNPNLFIESSASRARKLQIYWKNHPKEISSSVHALLSKDLRQRTDILRNIQSIVERENYAHRGKEEKTCKHLRKKT